MQLISILFYRTPCMLRNEEIKEILLIIKTLNIQLNFILVEFFTYFAVCFKFRSFYIHNKNDHKKIA